MNAVLAPLDVLRLYPPHAGTLRTLLASRAAAAPERAFLWFQGRSFSSDELAVLSLALEALYRLKALLESEV